MTQREKGWAQGTIARGENTGRRVAQLGYYSGKDRSKADDEDDVTRWVRIITKTAMQQDSLDTKRIRVNGGLFLEVTCTQDV